MENKANQGKKIYAMMRKDPQGIYSIVVVNKIPLIFFESELVTDELKDYMRKLSQEYIHDTFMQYEYTLSNVLNIWGYGD